MMNKERNFPENSVRDACTKEGWSDRWDIRQLVTSSTQSPPQK